MATLYYDLNTLVLLSCACAAPDGVKLSFVGASSLQTAPGSRRVARSP